jgi:thiamine-monophosphate kinase
MMRERDVLTHLAKRLPNIGDDCAVLPFESTHLVLTTDMLWERSDLPEGVSPHAIGWRAAAVSLSDIAAIGARPLGVVLALGAPEFERSFLDEMLTGVLDCCRAVGAPYVGGDLSTHTELTLVSSAVGEAAKPVRRSGARVGDLVCLTGALGRTAAALKFFERGESQRANRLFEFTPRVREGLALAPYVTSMIDVSDGLARSLHQLAAAGEVGFRVRYLDLPVVPEVEALARDGSERREMALYWGEDFELLFTLPPERLEAARRGTSFAVIGEVITNLEGVRLEEPDGRTDELPDRGYEHG